MLVNREIIQFAPRVKEVDRWYEHNFCADLDNGVYHKFGEEDEKEDKKKNNTRQSQDSLVSSFANDSMCSDEAEEEKRLDTKEKEKLKKKDQSEWQKIEVMIQKQNGKQEVEGTNSGALSSERTLIFGMVFMLT